VNPPKDPIKVELLAQGHSIIRTALTALWAEDLERASRENGKWNEFFLEQYKQKKREMDGR